MALPGEGLDPGGGTLVDSKARLEREFAAYLADIVPKEEFLAVFKETVTDLWTEKGKSVATEARQFEQRPVQLSETRKRIFEMGEDGSYAREEFQERKGLIDKEIEAVNASLHKANPEPFDVEEALAPAIGFIRDLAKGWLRIPPHTFSRFQKLIFPEGIAYDRE